MQEFWLPQIPPQIEDSDFLFPTAAFGSAPFDGPSWSTPNFSPFFSSGQNFGGLSVQCNHTEVPDACDTNDMSTYAHHYSVPSPSDHKAIAHRPEEAVPQEQQNEGTDSVDIRESTHSDDNSNFDASSDSEYQPDEAQQTPEPVSTGKGRSFGKRSSRAVQTLRAAANAGGIQAAIKLGWGKERITDMWNRKRHARGEYVTLDTPINDPEVVAQIDERQKRNNYHQRMRAARKKEETLSQLSQPANPKQASRRATKTTKARSSQRGSTVGGLRSSPAKTVAAMSRNATESSLREYGSAQTQSDLVSEMYKAQQAVEAARAKARDVANEAAQAEARLHAIQEQVHQGHLSVSSKQIKVAVRGDLPYRMAKRTGKGNKGKGKGKVVSSARASNFPVEDDCKYSVGNY